HAEVRHALAPARAAHARVRGGAARDLRLLAARGAGRLRGALLPLHAPAGLQPSAADRAPGDPDPPRRDRAAHDGARRRDRERDPDAPDERVAALRAGDPAPEPRARRRAQRTRARRRRGRREPALRDGPLAGVRPAAARRAPAPARDAALDAELLAEPRALRL